MLVLSRHPTERIILTIPPGWAGGEIVVTLVDTRAGKARIGINAPREIAVFREELLEGRDPT